MQPMGLTNQPSQSDDSKTQGVFTRLFKSALSALYDLKSIIKTKFELNPLHCLYNV